MEILEVCTIVTVVVFSGETCYEDHESKDIKLFCKRY